MAQKVTTMVLTVDLQSCCCYKKVKKLLCKFPEIRNQVYDEKKNTVTITVVCCNPARMKDKLCCKGGGCITYIEIIEPPKKEEEEKKKKEEEDKKKKKKEEEDKKKKEAQALELALQQRLQICIHSGGGCRCNTWTDTYWVCCSQCCHYGGRAECIIQ